MTAPKLPRPPGKLYKVGTSAHQAAKVAHIRLKNHALVHGPKYMAVLDDPFGINPFINKGVTVISAFGVEHGSISKAAELGSPAAAVVADHHKGLHADHPNRNCDICANRANQFRRALKAEKVFKA